MNKFIKYFASILALICLSTLVFAADTLQNIKLTRIQGSVMINTAGQYQPVTVETILNSDSKILMTKSASAQLVYPSGCSLNIKGDKILSPGNEANCKSGAPILVAANDNVVAVGDMPKEAAKQETLNTKTLLLLGAGGLAIGAIAASSSGSSNNTPSP